MTTNGWFQILFFLFVVFAITKPLGAFMAKVFNREKTFLDFALRPLEKLVYRVCGVHEDREMRWTEYGTSMLLFSVVSMFLLYLIERTQSILGFNPQKLANVAPDLAWNTAASFTTNTNWQSYVPETTMSYLTQMAGLAYHNFASAAVGIALATALIRGIARREMKTIGNFWVDLTRSFLWVLLPISFAVALVFVSQGVVQNFKPYAVAQLTEPQTVQTQGPDGKTTTQTVTQQTIAVGPVASQEAIKMFGTNGGGFFNTNSAHPFENPTPFTNFLQMILIFAIPSGLTYTLGRMTGSPRHGWAIWSAMAALFLVGVFAAYSAESRGNPEIASIATANSGAIDQSASTLQSGGNMEGKETRFGVANSALFATVTTDASCGAVNSMHDSFTPLGGMVPLLNIMLGEVIFGGVGSGLYGMIVFVILAVFIAGLMVGRTPEYLGKKIEAFDVKMAMLSVLAASLTILIFAAFAVVTKPGLAGISNPGPHGLSQILYAFTSSVGNNGSGFAGISANTLWYNTATGIAMLLGRFFVVIPILAIAGNLAAKKTTPASLGTFPVTGPLFATLLVSTIVIVGALTFFPALSLGPILEHLLMNAGRTF
ncbi:MAG TPA: potassium-transporting ATPase subunit KdpA [Candidatus Eremiobacteraceae bacterium]|jgi:potassium-transporting ATPase potassium-binding subunit|nr:potassium-transporting ATPase subunit KdpA [Candidatus Eremiobacteraceae bacterium]